MIRRVAAWAPVVGYMALVFYLSSLPNPLPALTHAVKDKILHGVEYAGLALLLVRALHLSGLALGRALAVGVLVASLFGASDEWHQSFVPGRDADPLDWAADTTGALLGGAAAAAFLRARRARASIGG